MGALKNKVLILHGWTYSTEKWDTFLKILGKKGLDYEMLKIPGLTAPLPKVWTINDYMGWLEEKIGKSESKVILIGHSNGGRIAAAYASLHPGKVERLILIDSAGLIHSDIKTVFKKVFFKTLAKAGSKITKSDSIRNLFYKALGEEDYNKADPVLKKTMVNLVSNDLMENFGRIRISTLILWGGNDKITPLSDARIINKLISGSKLKVIDNAKHSPQFTHPDIVADHILEFLNT